MAKSDAVKGLAGLVDALVGAAGNAVDDARKLVDEADRAVTKGAVVLTNLVDALDRISEPENEENTSNSITADGLISLLIQKGFKASYLETLNFDRLRNLYNTSTGSNWTDVTDKTGPVEQEPVVKSDRDIQVKYILSRPSAWYTEQMLSTLSDEEVEALYDHYRQVYRNRD